MKATTPEPTPEKEARASPGLQVPSPDRLVGRLGSWSALLTAALSLAWFAVFMLQQAVAPFPAWRGAAAYVPDYTPLHLLAFYPSILLPPVFLVLLAAVHVQAAAAKKVWSLPALAIGVV